jgi:hypothetical protein
MDKRDLLTVADIDGAEPSAFHIVPPKEIDPKRLQYIVVQVSERRYVVAKFHGTLFGNAFNYTNISVPMGLHHANRLAGRLGDLYKMYETVSRGQQ